MSEQSLILMGLLAICIVSAGALVRLIAVLRIFRRQRARAYSALLSLSSSNGGSASSASSVAPSRILVPSLVFHVLVFLCLVIEVPVYACRYASGGGFCRVGRPLYSLHLASYVLLFGAFCVIVTLWSDVAVFEPNDWTVLMNRSMLVLCLCYLLVTAAAMSVCLGLGNVKYFFASTAFLLFCAYSIAALLLLGTCFLVLGCLLQRRICRVLVTGSCTATITARVVRLNVVMLACFVCFTLRALMLAALVEVEAEGEVAQNFGKGWRRWEWDMRLEWAPHVIPCLAMLYLMRNSGAPAPSEADEARHSDENTEFGGGDGVSFGTDGKENFGSYGIYGGGS